MRHCEPWVLRLWVQRHELLLRPAGSVVALCTAGCTQASHAQPSSEREGSLRCTTVYLGSCFFLMGLWWSLCMLQRQLIMKTKTSQLSGSGKLQLIEGFIKAAVCIIGMGVESITVTSLGRPGNYTYTAIYASFLLAAVVDIAKGFRVVLPDGLDFIAHAIAFTNLGAVARSHATGHLHLTVATRLLTSYIALFNAGILLWELGRPQSQLLKNVRVACVMLQGVWFWQAGAVLDSGLAKRWVETEHFNLMFITIAFAWLMCGMFVLQILLFALTAKLCSFGSKVKRANRQASDVLEVSNPSESNGDHEYLKNTDTDASFTPI